MARTAAQLRAWQAYATARLAVVVATCDGRGCDRVFEGTSAQRRAAGWARAWRRRSGSGVEDQIDLCPSCRPGRGRRSKEGTRA
jgi:hypothetical protein